MKCKACDNEAYLDKRRNQHREYCTKCHNLYYRYGLDTASRQELLNNQDGKCAACNKPTQFGGQKNAHVDHCHNNGHIRGILCHACNTTLGLVKDNINHLQSLIQYLEKDNERNRS